MSKYEPSKYEPRFDDLKQGHYSDGSPLDEVQYLECKLILKPDRFTAAKVFFEYGKLVARTAKEFGIRFIANRTPAYSTPMLSPVSPPEGPMRDFPATFSSTTMRSFCDAASNTKTVSPLKNRKSFSSSGIPTCRRLRHWMYGRILPVIIGSSSRRRLCR